MKPHIWKQPGRDYWFCQLGDEWFCSADYSPKLAYERWKRDRENWVKRGH